jgi:hypothetical protein
MKLLLDTHILLWAAADPKRLSATATGLILDPDNELWSGRPIGRGRSMSRDGRYKSNAGAVAEDAQERPAVCPGLGHWGVV